MTGPRARRRAMFTVEDHVRALLPGLPVDPPPRRVEFIIAGGARKRLGLVWQFIGRVQDRLRERSDNLSVRVAELSSGSRYTTAWNDQPIDYVECWKQQQRRGSLFWGECHIMQALQHSFDDPELIDAIFLIGGGFDPWGGDLAFTERVLREHGPKIFVFHFGRKIEPYYWLPAATGGVYVELSRTRAFWERLKLVGRRIASPCPYWASCSKATCFCAIPNDEKFAACEWHIVHDAGAFPPPAPANAPPAELRAAP